MESRATKFKTDNLNQDFSSSLSTRSSRNANLYREVYGTYGGLDNLPIEDNTNEIDMARLKELILSHDDKKETKEIHDSLNILEQKKRRIDEQRLYDINKILEKAKYENNKLKDTVVTKPNTRRDILSTLESTELSLDDINKAKAMYQEKAIELINEENKEHELSMTRELKYKNLEKETNNLDSDDYKNNNDDNLSLDLFDDLKPTGNTIVTKPIIEEVKENKEIKPVDEKHEFFPVNLEKSDIHSNDTSDIDIIKKSSSAISNDFFTNSYEFSKKDFTDDDFFEEDNSGGGIFKIILLVLAIMVFVGVIVYFVGVYGLGLS